MSNNEHQDLVKKAIANNELDKLFLGQDGYEWGNLKHIPANVPTDISAILHSMYAIYNDGATDIPELLEDTIYKLTKGNAVEIWTAYSIVFSHYYDVLTNSSTFSIVSEKILICLRESISKNSQILSECHEYVGLNLKNGILEYINNSNRSFQKRFFVSIL